MTDRAVLIRYLTAIILSVILAVTVCPPLMKWGVNTLRHGIGITSDTETQTVSTNNYYYEDNSTTYNYYEETDASEALIREGNPDFRYVAKNPSYFNDYVGLEYMDLFYDEDWNFREDYLGYGGDDIDYRVEFWECDEKELDYVGYAFNTGFLGVTFNDGVALVYRDVDKEAFAGLIRSDTRDEYFFENIDGTYEWKFLGE